MNSIRFRARSAMLAGAAGLGAMLLGACDPKQELLAPQQPGVISPADVQSATGAEGLYSGAVGNFMRALDAGSGNQETIWQFSGLFADEYKTADTFSQRNDADQRVTHPVQHGGDVGERGLHLAHGVVGGALGQAAPAGAGDAGR